VIIGIKEMITVMSLITSKMMNMINMMHHRGDACLNANRIHAQQALHIHVQQALHTHQTDHLLIVILIHHPLVQPIRAHCLMGCTNVESGHSYLWAVPSASLSQSLHL
jgi:hypothetical protein